MQAIGIIGLLAIAACWVPQTIETIRAKQTHIKLSFLLLYSLGNLLLTVYAVIIGDVVFVLLNAFAMAMSLVNLFYRVFPKAFI